jgi:hypothetical protein
LLINVSPLHCEVVEGKGVVALASVPQVGGGGIMKNPFS